ncbi:MAG: RNA polymerase sigma factor FliA [Cellvibrionaceae bacterium]
MIAVDGISMYEQSGQLSNQPVVEDYAPLVKRIAQHMMVRMPASVQLEDLLQAGMIGLLEASQKYDASQGASFETYAGIRIRGSIIDEMRKGDWVPRSVHRNARQINQAMADVEAREGRDATSAEVAEQMGVDINEYHAMSQDAVCGRLFSIEESFNDEESFIENATQSSAAFSTPHSQTHRDILKESMVKAIQELPERERMVLSLYYDEELNLKEIGQILGVSESRISQIHSQAALRLRSRLQEWL